MTLHDLLTPTPAPPPYGEWGEPERLRHLVFLDGRLIDSWSEPVEGTSWAAEARRLDRLAAPAPEPPAPPRWQLALDWLGDRVGGAEAVARLHGEAFDEPELPSDCLRLAQRERIGHVAELLDAVAALRHDADLGVALRQALVALWRSDPDLVDHAVSARSVAGGLAWAVGKANGLLHPQGTWRSGELRDALGLTSSPAAMGRSVQAALFGLREPARCSWWRPEGESDLLALGHAEVLLPEVRVRLVRLRDRAYAVRAEEGATS
ncbi:hypothetical protein [Nocardioides acrostichi]|uniref:Uncharacterized protein n=1 Tax=Nocardioides acrostichi TaxID=2784339 RepID=A0A930V3R4_9ACTN|nr:hypothetical protein [Nocardioides acrostichi]MBF4163262.1 hypothetical protein [Nocardioides acrostichi]